MCVALAVLMRLSSIVLGLLVVCFRTGTVHACEPLTGFYATIADVSPSDGSDGFARNGAIRIAIKIWPETGQQVGVDASVVVTALPSNAVISGVLDASQLASGVMSWSPEQPLLANSQYQVVVQTTHTSRANIAGRTTISSTFTTSADLAPNLTLAGALRVTLRVGTAQIPARCDPCGINCTAAASERTALYADVEIPKVSGGDAADGYRAWLTLNDGVTPQFAGPGKGKAVGWNTVNVLTYVEPSGDDMQTVTVELPRESAPYEACFGFNAWDLARQSQSADPICVSKEEVAAAFASFVANENDAAAQTPTAYAQANCSAAISGRRPAASPWIACALVLCLFGLRRRARSASR
jgi:hypothetical protein